MRCAYLCFGGDECGTTAGGGRGGRIDVGIARAGIKRMHSRKTERMFEFGDSPDTLVCLL